MIRAILLDIDGTLTNDKKEITPKTREALLKVQKQGVRLALASGRPDQGLVKYAKVLEMDKHNGIFICYNGAKVMNCETGEVYFDQAMTVEEGKAVLEHMKKFKVSPIVAEGEYMYTNDVYSGFLERNGDPINIIEYESRSNGYILCEKRDLVEFADFPINKILTAGEPDYMKAHYEQMQEPFKDTLSCMFTSPVYFEFTAKGIDKAKAIDTVFGKLGYEAVELMAFGDAQNDLSMLKYAGVGVAMANAVDVVKDAADYITLSNNDDGIAAALETYSDWF
ncbi:MAG: HAD family phosphatase [Faecalicoccus sp.]|nr:HAD family phosphatase [Faecalicoccus sp.]